MWNLPAISGWFIAGFVALRLLGVTFVALLVARIIAAVKGRRADEALDLAAQRFATGQITEDQFRRIRDVLEP